MTNDQAVADFIAKMQISTGSVDRVKETIARRAFLAGCSFVEEKGDAVEFADWISKNNYISTTLPAELKQLWQKCEYPKWEGLPEAGNPIK